MADIFFPSFNEALPEPDAGLPVQSGSGSLASAFEGLMSGSTAIAKSYTDLNNARNKAEQAALNLDALDRPEEAEYLRGLGSTAFANPFKPDQNENLIAETEKLFSSTTSALRKAKADIDLQAARDAAANERILTSGSEAIRLQDKRTEGGLILGAQDLGNKIHLQSIENEFKAGQGALNRQENQLDRDTALDQTEMREVSAVYQTNQKIRAAMFNAIEEARVNEIKAAKSKANSNLFAPSNQITRTSARRIVAYSKNPGIEDVGSKEFMDDIVTPILSVVDFEIQKKITEARKSLVNAQKEFSVSTDSDPNFDNLKDNVEKATDKFKEITSSAAASVVEKANVPGGLSNSNGLPSGQGGSINTALLGGSPMVFPRGSSPAGEDDDPRLSNESVTIPDNEPGEPSRLNFKAIKRGAMNILRESKNNE